MRHPDREMLRTALRDVQYCFDLAALPSINRSLFQIRARSTAVNARDAYGFHGRLHRGVWRLVIGSHRRSTEYRFHSRSRGHSTSPSTLFAASEGWQAETYARAFYVAHSTL